MCKKNVAIDVVQQWIFCNIYPKELRTITHDLHSKMTEYNKALKKRATSKKVTNTGKSILNLLKIIKAYFNILGECTVLAFFLSFVSAD